MNFIPTSQIPPSQQNAYSDLGQGYGQYYGQQFGVIPERQEAEGGNTDTWHAHTDHYATPTYAHQQHQFHPGFYRDTYQEEDQPRTGNSRTFKYVQICQIRNLPSECVQLYKSSHNKSLTSTAR